MGIEYEYVLYYLDNKDSKIYLCSRTGEIDGNTIILQYLPHELVGNTLSKQYKNMGQRNELVG